MNLNPIFDHHLNGEQIEEVAYSTEARRRIDELSRTTINVELYPVGSPVSMPSFAQDGDILAEHRLDVDPEFFAVIGGRKIPMNRDWMKMRRDAEGNLSYLLDIPDCPETAELRAALRVELRPGDVSVANAKRTQR